MQLNVKSKILYVRTHLDRTSTLNGKDWNRQMHGRALLPPYSNTYIYDYNAGMLSDILITHCSY